jgi:ribosomal protein L37AE/L43A
MDSDQKSWDFVFTMTAYQPVWFKASDGHGSVDVPGFGYNKQGELKCWAIKDLPNPSNPGETLETQISWNYLYGSASLIIYFPYAGSFEYNPYVFAARNTARGDAVITPPDTGPGTLVLNGSFTDKGYDACPAYLTFNFFAEDNFVDGASGLGQGLDFFAGESDLALTPCKQDFRQDNGPICSKVKFDIWNENEAKLTGSYQCIKCWFEGILSEIGTPIWEKCDLGTKCKSTGVGGQKFTKAYLKTDLGRFRVTPDTFAACKGVFAKLGQDGKTPVDVCGDPANQVKTPFLGVLLTGFGIFDTTFDRGVVVTAATPATAGSWTAGAPSQPLPGILWDPGVGDRPAAKR